MENVYRSPQYILKLQEKLVDELSQLLKKKRSTENEINDLTKYKTTQYTSQLEHNLKSIHDKINNIRYKINQYENEYEEQQKKMQKNKEEEEEEEEEEDREEEKEEEDREEEEEEEVWEDEEEEEEEEEDREQEEPGRRQQLVQRPRRNAFIGKSVRVRRLAKRIIIENRTAKIRKHKTKDLFDTITQKDNSSEIVSNLLRIYNDIFTLTQKIKTNQGNVDTNKERLQTLQTLLTTLKNIGVKLDRQHKTDKTVLTRFETMIQNIKQIKRAKEERVHLLYDLSKDVTSTICLNPYFSELFPNTELKCPSRLQRISNFLGKTRRQIFGYGGRRNSRRRRTSRPRK